MDGEHFDPSSSSKSIVHIANSKGSGENARERRLAWAFSGRLCDKMPRLIWVFAGHQSSLICVFAERTCHSVRFVTMRLLYGCKFKFKFVAKITFYNKHFYKPLLLFEVLINVLFVGTCLCYQFCFVLFCFLNIFTLLPSFFNFAQVFKN